MLLHIEKTLDLTLGMRVPMKDIDLLQVYEKIAAIPSGFISRTRGFHLKRQKTML